MRNKSIRYSELSEEYKRRIYDLETEVRSSNSKLQKSGQELTNLQKEFDSKYKELQVLEEMAEIKMKEADRLYKEANMLNDPEFHKIAEEVADIHTVHRSTLSRLSPDIDDDVQVDFDT